MKTCTFNHNEFIGFTDEVISNFLFMSIDSFMNSFMNRFSDSSLLTAKNDYSNYYSITYDNNIKHKAIEIEFISMFDFKFFITILGCDNDEYFYISTTIGKFKCDQIIDLINSVQYIIKLFTNASFFINELSNSNRKLISTNNIHGLPNSKLIYMNVTFNNQISILMCFSKYGDTYNIGIDIFDKILSMRTYKTFYEKITYNNS